LKGGGVRRNGRAVERNAMFNEAMQKALAQAREMQRHITAAATEAADQMKPHLAQSIENAKALQATLAAHAAQQSTIASKNADGALSNLSDYIKMGSEAMKESIDVTRATTLKMVDQSKKIVEAATSALSKDRE
jgi:hypothetical protein